MRLSVLLACGQPEACSCYYGVLSPGMNVYCTHVHQMHNRTPAATRSGSSCMHCAVIVGGILIALGRPIVCSVLLSNGRRRGG
jgi:hypothetical protein